MGLAVCALVLIRRVRRSGSGPPSDVAGNNDADTGEVVEPAPQVGFALLGISGFIAVAVFTSTLLALALLVGFLMFLFGERRIALLLATPLLFAGFVHVVFVRLFGVSLPGVW